jgi:hypothetical protein
MTRQGAHENLALSISSFALVLSKSTNSFP